MSNNITIIRNKLSITKVLLSLAISISVGNGMFYTDPYDSYEHYYKNLMIPLDEQEEGIFNNSSFENNLLNDSKNINKNDIDDNIILKHNDDKKSLSNNTSHNPLNEGFLLDSIINIFIR